VVLVRTTTFAEQQQPTGQPPKAESLIGGGLMMKNKPFKGVDTKVYPLPFYIYRGQRFSLRGPYASYDMVRQKDWSVKAVAKLRTDGYDADDSSDLAGMSDRDVSVDVGVGLTVGGAWGNVEMDLLTDALGKHKGQEITLTYAKPLRGPLGIEKLTLSPLLGLSWRSKQLNDYYYGVRAGEVQRRRALYDSGSCVNPTAGLMLNYELSERWSIFGMFQNEWLGSEITDSPVVDEHHISSLIIGLLYRL
jgi:outer membrane protein